MNTRKITTEYRMTQWTQRIQERKLSGLNIKEYCEKLGISRDSYYYWQRKLREAVCEQIPALQSMNGANSLISAGFSEVKIQGEHENSPSYLSHCVSDGHIVIELSGIRMTAERAYPVEKLVYLLRELVIKC